ncbi:putative pyranose oxidase [Mycena olivaceomarginata]|nr:putative pyranose oxidase [Mycena olivaceomarginata]
MSDLPLHRVHKDIPPDQLHVFIAGSGPIGATYARLLVAAGYNVMAETGDQETRIPAAHKKNEIEYQKDIDRFVRVIQGALSTVSMPPSSMRLPTLDPSAWRPKDHNSHIRSNGSNPNQIPHKNLPGEAVTRGIGGMSTHWTCSTPEFQKDLERPKIFTDKKDDNDEWNLLYKAARALIGTSEKEFEESIRHNVILETLQKAYHERGVKALPLACHRVAKGSPYVQWHAADSVYGKIFEKRTEGDKRGKFVLLTNSLCTKLHLDKDDDKLEIRLAEIKDLLDERSGGKANSFISAKIFVVAAGAIGTPQILANSGSGGTRDVVLLQRPIPQLGIGITEQPMAFCQVVLCQELVDDIDKELDKKPDWWKKAVEDHKKNHPKDPLPIPFQDGEPQVTIPVSNEKDAKGTWVRPWHAQIHRDAFSYGEAGPRVDPRVVVDLRFFGMQHPVETNKIIFEKDIKDAYGMPQPTFEYIPSPDRALEATRMMNDMTDVANKLGGYLPGASPQFMALGLALHLGGTTRLGQGNETGYENASGVYPVVISLTLLCRNETGTKNDLKTTANYNSQIWDFTNLYVGGNGVIPTPFASNLTLTSMCFAIRSAYKIHLDLQAGKLTPPVRGGQLLPTPKDWVTAVCKIDDSGVKTKHFKTFLGLRFLSFFSFL